MNKITFSNQYGIYPDCYFSKGHYGNGNLAIEIWQDMLGPVTKVTVNPDIKLPHDRIAIKNYSENEGMVEWLLKHELIEETPLQTITSGWVEIPVYKITEKFKEYLDI